MSTNELPNPSELPQANDHELHIIVSTFFEDSRDLQAIVTSLLKSHQPESYQSFIDLVRKQLKTRVPTPSSLADPANAEQISTLDAILNSHPRLGEKRTNLSASSAAEQAKLQSSPNEGQALQLARLNKEYESCFDGLRYLVFVNGRDRTEICKDMQRRIERADPWTERVEGIDALCDIALDRVKKMSVAGK